MSLKKAAPIFLLTLLLFGIPGLLIRIEPAGAVGIIYIRSDGSIDPPTAPISQNGNKYTLTSSTFDSIIVQKSNIIIDGADLTLQGSGSGTGIDLSGLTGVVVMRIVVRAFENGIYVSSSDHITISGSTLVDNNVGIWVSDSSYNNIVGNTLSSNVFEGIYVYYCSNTQINGNLIQGNTFDGIYLFSSSDNTIFENTIANNAYGISPYYSTNNRIYHNGFINNQISVNANEPADIWDDGYPNGGNFWSDYNGIDQKHGANQDLDNSDGIGDVPYTIDTSNQDRYPLIKPYAGTHDIGVLSVNSSKTIVVQGYSMNISVRVINYGVQVETFNVAVKADLTTIGAQTVALSGRDSATVTLTCGTVGLARGSYAISASVGPVADETDTADNTLVGERVTVAYSGDVTGDGIVDIFDIVTVATVFGNAYPAPGWNPNADINNDGIIDIFDIVAVAVHFGEIGP